MPTMSRPGKARRRRQRERKGLLVLLTGAALPLSLAGGLVWLAGGPAGAPAARAIGGPFRLVSDAGAIVTDRDFRGEYLLVYFGYTSCPDVCPTTLGDMAAALGRLGPRADRVQPVFVTVDPARDTPPVLAKYLASFSPRLIGLTGSPEAIAATERAYHVSAVRDGPGASRSAIDHSAVLFLMGPDGRFVAALSAAQGAAALAAGIERHLPAKPSAG